MGSAAFAKLRRDRAMKTPTESENKFAIKNKEKMEPPNKEGCIDKI